MVSCNQEGNNVGNEVFDNCGRVKSLLPLQVSVSHKELEGEEINTPISDDNLPKRKRFLQVGPLASPTVKFQKIAAEREGVSRTVPSSTSQAFRDRFHKLFSRTLDRRSLWKIAKEWIKNPMNMALFVWMIAVAVSGAILFLVMIGVLNQALPKKSQRNTWFEINNQILNALFTLMCLYQHPKRIYHFVLLFEMEN